MPIMGRTEKIASIIEKRLPLANKIETVRANFQSLGNRLRQLQQTRDRLFTQELDPNITRRLEEINFDLIFRSLDRVSKKLDTLKERFSRPTLNIGVVGLMGQGKSTLLKSLSGLSDNEIPALEGGACTAVRSTIENKLGETTARVTLHSETTFLKEVIYPYYDELGLDDKPANIEDFANKKFSQIVPSSATDEKMYAHLREDYHFNLKKYRNLLQSSTPKTYPVKTEEIPDYVMQRRDEDDRLTSFQHLAVRQVKIYCRFQNSDVGKISLVDIPGLGDSRLGDEKLMLKTLGEEVDIVLFIKRPDPLRYQWQPIDTLLYDTAASALNNLPRRSFIILNHSRRTNNLKGCETLQKNLDTMRVIDCFVADCSKTEEVIEVFDRVLDYLASNIESVDRQYLSLFQEEVMQVKAQVDAEIDKSRRAFGVVVEEDKISPLFVPLFNQFRKDITKGLTQLLEQLRQQRHEEDIDFKHQIKNAIVTCRQDRGLPSIEEIEERNFEVGGYDIAYGIYLNEVRSHLSQHFLSLDRGLKRSLERVKSQVAEVLIREGRLGGLTEVRGAEFLRAIASVIPEELIPEQPSKIKFGFEILADFELSYRGFIQHRIRRHLDILTPNEAASLKLSQSPNASQVLECLHTAHSEAIYRCENALEDLLNEPSQAAFAIVEEFIDRVLRAAGVEDEWRIFLDRTRSQIWSEFQDLDRLRTIQKEWLESVDRLATANQSSYLQFFYS